MSPLPTPQHRFAAAMDRLGPFEPAPRLAVALSGGADSTALTLLADAWARARGGQILGLIVDHRLRPESTNEARLTNARMAERGIPTRILTLRDLHSGPALAERARSARYHALTRACARAGIAHLLLGHHARDQAETVMLRALGGSLSAGLAGMAALVERGGPRLLRPLLSEPAAALRAFLHAQGMGWVEDPSNQSAAARRPRLRAMLNDEPGDGAGTTALTAAARIAGEARARDEQRLATILAERVTIRPEGFAILSPDPIDPGALAAVIRAISGRPFPPPLVQLAAWGRAPRPTTLSGIRVSRAERFGDGWLLTREPRALGPPVPARRGAVWDGRFRLLDDVPDGVTIAALGTAERGLRRRSGLPAVVTHVLPALWFGNTLAAVPHLFYRNPAFGLDARLVFAPAEAMVGAPFLPPPGNAGGMRDGPAMPM
jgi:tRNA(Ile)-lysidine synthase